MKNPVFQNQTWVTLYDSMGVLREATSTLQKNFGLLGFCAFYSYAETTSNY